MKPRRLLLAIAAFTLSLHGTDEKSVTVKAISVEKGAVMVSADLQGKPTELTCEIRFSSCSQPQPGDYTMRSATADEGIYQDCTNVVLLKSSGATKEKIGVYCWSSADDCYIYSCQKVEVATFTSDLPNVIVPPEVGPLPLGGGPVPLTVRNVPSPTGSSRPAVTRVRSWRCFYLWKCSTHNL